MRILVVQESDWLKRNPHQQHHLMERLALKGYEIKVIDYDIDWRKDEKETLRTKREVYNNVHKISEEASIEVIRPGTVKVPVLEYLSLYYSHKAEIKRQIKDFKPDIIVGFGILNTYVASKLARKYDIPFVYYWIDALDRLIPAKYFQFLGRYLEKRTIKNSSKLITINKKLADFVIELGADEAKTSVISAGIDLERFDPRIDGKMVRETYGIKDSDLVLFFMGWLYHFSGLKEVAIELSKMKEKNPNTKLMIVGDGDAFKDLQKIKKEYDLNGRLILTGKQPYEKIPEFIAAADICLLPADPYEKIMQDIVPIKIYEYMAMEKSVVTTMLPGVMKEFEDGHGVIYVERPEDALKKAAALIGNGRIHEEGINARNFVEKYRWDTIISEFERVLKVVSIK